MGYRKRRESIEEINKKRMDEIRLIENPSPSIVGEAIHLLLIEYEDIQNQIDSLKIKKQNLYDYLPKLAEAYRERAYLIETMLKENEIDLSRSAFESNE